MTAHTEFNLSRHVFYSYPFKSYLRLPVYYFALCILFLHIMCILHMFSQLICQYKWTRKVWSLIIVWKSITPYSSILSGHAFFSISFWMLLRRYFEAPTKFENVFYNKLRIFTQFKLYPASISSCKSCKCA